MSKLSFSPLLILGADSPTLSTTFIQRALDVLSAGEADISLGPTHDGGYYLVGLWSPVPGLFQNVAWSTPAAFEQTAAHARALNLRLHLLPCWYDVDTPADVECLREQIISDAGTQQRAPNTFRWFTKIGNPFENSLGGIVETKRASET